VQEPLLPRQPDNHNPRKGKSERYGSERKPPQRQSITSVKGGQLPKWAREEIQRTTPKDRREPAMAHLTKAMTAFADERYPASVQELRKAKELAPRSSMVRELLGLAAYRSGQWKEALSELRTFRRITGDLIHMPVEMDCLRALGKSEDVEKTWERIQEYDISATISHEARVVYGSYLLDEGRPMEAWPIIKPKRLVASPSPGELRRWYVAARVALAAGDKEAANKIVTALEDQEVDFDGVEQLREQLD